MCSSEKVSNLSDRIQRIYYTAFFYSNYALRHIEYNNPNIVNIVSKYKKIMMNYINKYNEKNASNIRIDITELFDYMIESFCYMNSECPALTTLKLMIQ